MEYVVDTSFLVKLWRDKTKSPEHRFIQQNLELTIGLSWIAKAEFLRGVILASQKTAAVDHFLNRYITIWPNENTLLIYANIYADRVRRNAALVGTHDLWIAALCLEHNLHLLTRNVKEFSRISNLKLIDYTQS